MDCDENVSTDGGTEDILPGRDQTDHVHVFRDCAYIACLLEIHIYLLHVELKTKDENWTGDSHWTPIFSDAICEQPPQLHIFTLNECLIACRKTVLDQVVHLKTGTKNCPRTKFSTYSVLHIFVFVFIFPIIQPDTAEMKLAHAQAGPGDGKKTDNYN